MRSFGGKIKNTLVEYFHLCLLKLEVTRAVFYCFSEMVFNFCLACILLSNEKTEAFFFFLSPAQKQETLLDEPNTNTHTHNPCKKFLLPADMVSSQTQPRHGSSTQLSEYHMLPVFLWNILMLNLRGATSLCSTWPPPPVTSPTSVVVTLLSAMQLQQRLCSASGLRRL